jgi:hypothetical protein
MNQDNLFASKRLFTVAIIVCVLLAVGVDTAVCQTYYYRRVSQETVAGRISAAAAYDSENGTIVMT